MHTQLIIFIAISLVVWHLKVEREALPSMVNLPKEHLSLCPVVVYFSKNVHTHLLIGLMLFMQ